nr:hypothetical protein CFP56_39530 [Quercus suber]
MFLFEKVTGVVLANEPSMIKLNARKRMLIDSKKRPRPAEKEPVEKASSALVIQEPRTSSPIVSLEELTPRPKKSKNKEIEVDEIVTIIAEGNTPEDEDEAPQFVA